MQVFSSPELSGDGKTVYFGSYSGYLYAVHSNNGTERWKFDCGDVVIENGCHPCVLFSPFPHQVQSSPKVSNDDKVVFVGSGNRNLHAIETNNGKEVWSYRTGDMVEFGFLFNTSCVIY